LLSIAPIRDSMASVAAPPDEPVAIVCFLSGNAVAKVDDKRMELQLFQRLRPGSIVETKTGSRVVLTFFTGNRYEFGEVSSGTVGRTALERRKGAVRELTPVPAIAEIVPIAKDERAGARLAATRIRTEDAAQRSISNLYPSEGAATFADTTVVRFDPVGGYEKYRVELEDETGHTVFAVETPSTIVQIPRDVLRPSTSYYWRVRTLDRERPALRGAAVFSTLSKDNARRRAAFKRHVEETGDNSLLGLMAELDRSLGLQQEACAALKAALAHSVGNQPIEAAQSRFRCSGR
jgi:hypothetical protein